MDQKIKNRLVGVVVIFALAVIFLPMILDGAGVRKDELEVVIPPQPLVTADPEFEPKIVELQVKADALPELDARHVDENTPANAIERDSAGSTKASSQSQPAKAQAAAKDEPVAVARSAPVENKPEPGAASASGGDTWVLQVGSFQDRSKALAQRDKLRRSNIAAVFIEEFEIDNRPSYRVRLGPFLTRDQTRVAQNKIKAKHDIDGIIMKYER